MGETAKAVCVLVLLIASITAAAAWIDDRPNAMVWSFRIGSSLLAVAALGLILKLQFRADLAHDYLRDYAKQYFNRDGFCFAFAATVVDGIAYLDAIFQNQYENPCLGRIALRPAQGFFMNRAKIETIAYEIELGPAAYGVARLAIPIPGKLQGQRQSFEVGASAYFPDGKGRRLRFQDGLRLRQHELRRQIRHGANHRGRGHRHHRVVEARDRDAQLADRRRGGDSRQPGAKNQDLVATRRATASAAMNDALKSRSGTPRLAHWRRGGAQTPRRRANEYLCSSHPARYCARPRVRLSRDLVATDRLVVGPGPDGNHHGDGTHFRNSRPTRAWHVGCINRRPRIQSGIGRHGRVCRLARHTRHTRSGRKSPSSWRSAGG